MIYYFEVVVIGSILDPLTYHYNYDIPLGSIANVTLQKKDKKALVYKRVDKPEFDTIVIIDITNNYYPQKIIDSAFFIHQYYISSFGEALGLFYPYSKVTKSTSINIELDFTLSNEQKEAYNFIKNHDSTLLFGDTGSGKTEIYISLIADMLKEAKSSILLLPEISLTPQIQKRLKDKFGDFVEVWHSKITKSKRENIIQKISDQKIRVIVGARSALFLPFDDLGLIIVDEEHDDSYKSAQKPRVNVKDFAQYYAKRIGAKILLGSATPSINSYNKLPTIRLKGKFFKSNNSIYYDISESKITDFLIQKIGNTLNQNKQVIIFLPTRANFKHIQCHACGSSIECPYCSVNMSLHKSHNYLRCHYCNYTSAIPQKCPSCGEDRLISNRIGTAQVVESLSEIFPNSVVSKFDTDEIKTQKELKRVLSDFNAKNIDILVGTQMISKGHDYHDVGLSIIMGVDNILQIPDFRSRQKAMSTVIQVAGRSGRKSDGEVVIQTLNSEFFTQYLNNYEKFLDDEIEFAKGLYPPHTKLARLLFSHVKPQKAKQQMDNMLKSLAPYKNIEIVGFGESPIQKISNKYRYQILIRSKSIKHLLTALHQTKRFDCAIDVDPINFS
jgi:primosomal protein N' (replication factor Y)